jgi:hypothetical protein
METVSEIKKLTKLLKRSFDETPWYGPSIKEVLNDITPEIANNQTAQLTQHN